MHEANIVERNSLPGRINFTELSGRQGSGDSSSNARSTFVRQTGGAILSDQTWAVGSQRAASVALWNWELPSLVEDLVATSRNAFSPILDSLMRSHHLATSGRTTLHVASAAESN